MMLPAGREGRAAADPDTPCEEGISRMKENFGRSGAGAACKAAVKRGYEKIGRVF